MKKIHLHIGAHKSASTTIQRNLINNIEKLNEEFELNFIGGTELSSRPIGQHFRKISKGYFTSDKYDEYLSSIEAAKSSIIELLESIKEANIIISWEGFLGHSALDKYEGIYTYSKQISESLKSIFVGYEPEITIVVRRQDDFIESCYLQQIKENRSLSFDEFISAINIKNISWLKIVNDFEGNFKGDVNVIPFESIKYLGTKSFLELFLSMVKGEHIKINDYTLVEKANPSFSALGVEVSRNLLPKLSKNRRGELNKILFSELSSVKYAKASFVNEFYRKLIVNKCSKENEVLFDKYIFNSNFLTTNVIEPVKSYWFDK